MLRWYQISDGGGVSIKQGWGKCGVICVDYGGYGGFGTPTRIGGDAPQWGCQCPHLTRSNLPYALRFRIHKSRRSNSAASHLAKGETYVVFNQETDQGRASRSS